MRLIIELFFLAVLCGCSKPPPFTFRQLNGSTTVTDAVARGIVGECYKDSDGQTCKLLGPPLAGSYYSKGTISFDKGKFSSLAILFSPEQLGNVRDNLTAAYGQPCRREVGEAETSLGPVASNERLLWCFNEGELVLERAAYGDDEHSLVEFPASSRNHATATSANSL